MHIIFIFICLSKLFFSPISDCSNFCRYDTLFKPGGTYDAMKAEAAAKSLLSSNAQSDLNRYMAEQAVKRRELLMANMGNAYSSSSSSLSSGMSSGMRSSSRFGSASNGFII